MTRRPAVTLIEVLISMFIMAIGMLALLVLFPLGAVSMGQALKDDRCASTAAMAENVAVAMDVRHDTALPASNLVYIDPIGTTNGLATAVGGAIPRSGLSFVTSSALADRWFSLPDDITFMDNGSPNTVLTGGIIDRGRRYSYAYLLRQLPGSANVVQLYVVVYSGRPVGVLNTEPTYYASPPALPVLGSAGSNSLTIPASGTSVKRGGWVLDSGNGYFYRVTNIADPGAGATTVDVQTNLVANVTQITVMDNVAEVFDKGTDWRP